VLCRVSKVPLACLALPDSLVPLASLAESAILGSKVNQDPREKKVVKVKMASM